MNPVTHNLITDPNATFYEPLPCDDIDRLHTTSHAAGSILPQAEHNAPETR
jgi:hypothetical protein